MKLQDVLDLVTTVAHDPTQFPVIQWLFPEAVQRKKQEDVLKRHEAALEKALAFMPPQKAEE